MIARGDFLLPFGFHIFAKLPLVAGAHFAVRISLSNFNTILRYNFTDNLFYLNTFGHICFFHKKMFTMRRKVVEGIKINGGDTVSKGRRRASTFIEQQNCNQDMPNGEIDEQKRLKSKRNSLMIPGSSTPNNECLIHLMLGPGCFRELRRNCGGGSIYSFAIYNLICSLLVFALRILSQPQTIDKNGKKNIGKKCPEYQHPVTVLLEAPKVPLKALRIVLRACQSALAYRIRQCILLEPDTFLSIHQRRMATIDLLLLDTYDFKIQICHRQKLSKYLGLSALFDLQQIWQPSTSVQKPLFGDKSEGFQPNNGGGWTDLKRGFLNFFAENPSYFAANPANNILWNKDVSTPASLGRFMRKDGNVLIELVEFDLDSVPRDTIKKAIPIIQNTIQSPTKDKNENNTKMVNNLIVKIPTKDSSMNKFEVDAFSKSLPSYKKAMNLMKVHGGIGDHNRHKSLEERGEGRENKKIGEKLVAELTEATEISRLAKSVQSVIGWLGEHGERRLAKLEEVEKALNFGTSNSPLCENVEMRKIDGEKRELAQEMENILNNLATVADQLKAMGQKKTRQITYFGISGDENGEEKPKADQQKKSTELIAIGQLLLGAQSRANTLRAGLTSFTLRMERGRQFQKTVDEFHSAANSFILDLCSERTIEIYGKELNDQKIRGKIAELRGNMEKLEKLASSATEAGSTLCSILMENNKQSFLDLCSAELATIDGRRRRCSALMELRVGRLNQQMEIIKCEQFGEQIIKRFNNSLAENNVKILGDLLKNRRNGKRLVDYARQLANLASILRKINQFEATPAERFNRELEILWRMLEKKYENGESGL